jgi:hypothetical protein
MWVGSDVGVLGVDRLRGERQQQRPDGRRGESNQAGSETAICAR